MRVISYEDACKGKIPLTQGTYIQTTQLIPEILLLTHDFGEANLDILSQITE